MLASTKMTITDHSEIITLRFPKWVIYPYSVCNLLCSIALLSLLVFGDYTGMNFIKMWKPGICGFFIFLMNWVQFRIFLSSVIITNNGLETKSPVSIKRFIKWEDIIEVKRPFLGIPNEYTYVVSLNNKIITLCRSIPEYQNIIKTIQERSLNLKKCNC